MTSTAATPMPTATRNGRTTKRGRDTASAGAADAGTAAEARPLAGRVAVVSGGSGGIGQAVARELAGLGAHVAVHYHRRGRVALALCEELGQRCAVQRFVALEADLSREGAAEALLRQAVGEMGRVDILVTAAGINRDGTLAKAAPDRWREVVDVNLMGVVACCRAALPHFEGWGRIVNISSIIGATGNFGQTNYAAAKAGLFGFTKSLAAEVARRGITVNAVAPGFIDTPMTAGMPERFRHQWEARSPLGRFGTPDEVAYCVGFLASPRASYVTGTVLHVNGGSY